MKTLINVLCLLFLLTTTWAAQELFVNGGFEQELAGYDANVNAITTTDVPHLGERCLRVDGNENENSFVQQTITVQGGREYDFSVWIRSENVPEGADCKAYYNVWQNDIQLFATPPFLRICGTTGWFQQSARITIPHNATKITVILQLYKSTGTVWFDDVSLVPVQTVDEAERQEKLTSAQNLLITQAVELSQTTPEVATGIRYKSDDDGIFLCNERLALLFSGPREAFGLRAIIDLKTKRSFIIPDEDNSIFKIELRPTAYYLTAGMVLFASDTPAENCKNNLEIKDDEVVLHLKWLSIPAEGTAILDVETTISLKPEDFSRWQITVSNNQSGSGIWLVDFPRFTSLGVSGENASENDYMAISLQQGWKWRNPRQTIDWSEGCADYPSGGKSMQFEAYCLDATIPSGLYFATEDPKCYRKSIHCKSRGDAFTHILRNFPEDMGKTTSYEMPYPAVVGAFSGDWWDAAQIYRKWALQQPWSVAGPVKDKASTPKWLKETGFWAQGDMVTSPDPNAIPPDKWLDRLQQIVQSPLALHVYMWSHVADFDKEYPFLTPPKPEALDFVKQLQSKGIHVIPYQNIYAADATGSRFKAENLDALLVQNPSGDPYGSLTGLVPMCVATEQWQKLVSHEFTTLNNIIPIDGHYLDQLTGAAFMCFNSNHGHPVGGGNYFSQGLRKICTSAREALNKGHLDEAGNSSGMLFGENISECYNDLIDAQLPWYELEVDRILPLYQAVYADYTIRFGLFIGRPDIWGEAEGYYSKMGWTFITGQQPGWFMYNILNEFVLPPYKPLQDFLHDLVACRLASLDFLQYGQMLRPLDLNLSPVPVNWDDWSKPKKGVFAPVMNSVWKAPDGRIGIALVNWTKTEQTITLPISDEWHLSGDLQIRQCIAGNWSEYKPVSPEALKITIPAHSTQVIELRHRGHSPS